MAPKISMNVTTTFFGNVVQDIRLAKEAGYTGIELQSPKLYRYLDAGFDVRTLPELLAGLEVTGLGAVLDIERQGPAREEFLAEVDRMCKVAVAVGAPSCSCARTGGLETSSRTSPPGGSLRTTAATARPSAWTRRTRSA